MQRSITKLFIIDQTIKIDNPKIFYQDDQLNLIISYQQNDNEYQNKNVLNIVISQDFNFQNLYLAINQLLQKAVDKENLNLQKALIITKRKNLIYFQMLQLKKLLKTDFQIDFIDCQEKNYENKKKINQKIENSIEFRQEIIYDSKLNHNSQKISVIIQKYFFKQAQYGNLLIPCQQFQNEIYLKIQAKFPFISQNMYENILDEIENIQIFQTISRKFEDFDEIQFCGLHLKTLSFQSIYWILKSLQIDKMTPTQKIFFSRIKECFAFKIDLAGQQRLIDYIIDNKYFFVEKQETQNIIWIQDMKWETDDQNEFQSQDQSAYNNLIIFLNLFFDKKDQKNIWISSVESVLTKVSQKKPQKMIQRAIPGGKYGCIQFIKCCAPQSLKEISFGKLAMLVQKTIDNQFLVYHKTLLIRNDQQLNHTFDEQSVERINKINYLQQKIYSILQQNNSGVPIAILPKILQKSINFKFDLYDLGFTKLKKFLNYIPYIIIENKNPNKVFVLLEHQFYIKDQIYEINDFLKQFLIYNINGFCINQIEQIIQKEFQLQIKFDFKQYYSKNDLNFLYVSDCGIVKFVKDKKCKIQSDQFYPQNKQVDNYDQEIQNIKFINALLQDFEFDQENYEKKTSTIFKNYNINKFAFNENELY